MAPFLNSLWLEPRRRFLCPAFLRICFTAVRPGGGHRHPQDPQGYMPAHTLATVIKDSTAGLNPNSDPSAALPAGPRGPTSRIEYGAGSAAPEKTTIVLDSPYDRHISHARDGAGSEVSPHRLTSLLPSHGVRQTGPSAVKVGVCYISRTRSWVKPTIWLPSPPMGLTIHIGAQDHGEPRGIC